MIGLVLSVVLGVVAAGLCSGMESAFLACPRLKVRHLAKAGNTEARIMEQALRSPETYLTTLLVGTNLAIVGATVAATTLMERWWPGRGHLAATLVLAPVFLVVGEVIPKSYFLSHARSVCVALAGPLTFLKWALLPLTAVVSLPARVIHRPQPRGGVLSREELALLAEPSVSRVRMAASIAHVLRMGVGSGSGVAAEIMRPASAVLALPAELTVAAARSMTRGVEELHFPVSSQGRWVGVVHLLDLWQRPGHLSVGECAWPLPMVSPATGLEEIVSLMRESAEHVVAVGEDGYPLGLVCLEHLLGHLVVPP